MEFGIEILIFLICNFVGFFEFVLVFVLEFEIVKIIFGVKFLLYFFGIVIISLFY